MTATVTLPAGVRHHTTTAFAESWAAYDALSDFTERVWHVAPDGRQCDPELPGARRHVEKERQLDDGKLVVFPPHTPRECAEASS